MAITLTIERPDAIVHLKARKTMAGDIMLFDHPDVDVVISPEPAQNPCAFKDSVWATHICHSIASF